MTAFDAALVAFGWFAIGYFIVLNTWYLALIVLAGVGAASASRRRAAAGLDKIFQSQLAPPVSIVVPTRNEERWIVECVRGLLDLRYPVFEVIVVDDGSTDATFERLARAFRLTRTQRVVPQRVPTLAPVRSVHTARGPDNLLVIRKEGAGRPADAVNTGVNAASYPLVCRVDADTYLDADALLAVVKPFVEDPDRMVAVGASVRVANASQIRDGRVVRPRMPGGWLTSIQSVEYLRAFLMGRTAWSQFGAMLFIPGVFGVYRRDVFVAVGGLDLGTDGDDVEFVARIHHQMRRARIPYRIGFVPEPCCWTQIPDSYRELARQRRRWAHTLSQALLLHRDMIGRPRYGVIGTLVLPYFLVFELASAPVELLAVAAFVLAAAAGVAAPGLTLLFVVAAWGYVILLSIAAMLIEELSYYRYRTWRDITLLIFGAVAENVGFRLLHAWWRLRGMAAASRRDHADWAPTGSELRGRPVSGRP